MRARWFFGFFLLSGFCSLVDEVVWLRISMSHFGVGAPLVAIVLSVFMGGLALGSLAAGILAKRAEGGPALAALRLYAAAELCVAASAFVVPPLLDLSRRALIAGEGAAPWGSALHHAAAGVCLAVILLPFCACMGATFPLALAALREPWGSEDGGPVAFGHLYAANVLGATLGALASAFVLIELFGFRGTLKAAAMLNVVIALGAVALDRWRPGGVDGRAQRVPAREVGIGAGTAAAHERDGRVWLIALFVTGLVSMAMEIVWVRQFTPYVGTVVYAFATILALYLAATFLGSAAYRLGLERRRFAPWAPPGFVWSVAGLAALLPLLATDPRLPFPIIYPANPQPRDLIVGGVRVALGLSLYCAVIGFMTPRLVDRFAGGDPDRAGRAYAVHIAGCILGPLLAGFGLLPWIGERGTIVVLALPLFALAPLAARRGAGAGAPRSTWLLSGAAFLVGLVLVGATEDYAGLYPDRTVRRDHEATVIATDARGRKELLVNGVGITSLTPITKVMVHLPLAFLTGPPRSVLVICFGMGTSFRSALAWDVPTSAAELVPSVPDLFGFYHADGPALLASPLAHVVVDDGRRYLERSADQYDLITIDPPPPVEAAGSSLLYSREFYALARLRLRPGGIVQQWVPGGEPLILISVTRALTESFRYVRVFRSVEGWGHHLLASDTPFPERSAADLASRLPPRAAADLVEWFVDAEPRQVFEVLLAQEVPPAAILAASPDAPPITDDRPFNEYYLLRRLLM